MKASTTSPPCIPPPHRFTQLKALAKTRLFCRAVLCCSLSYKASTKTMKHGMPCRMPHAVEAATQTNTRQHPSDQSTYSNDPSNHSAPFLPQSCSFSCHAQRFAPDALGSGCSALSCRRRGPKTRALAPCRRRCSLWFYAQRPQNE